MARPDAAYVSSSGRIFRPWQRSHDVTGWTGSRSAPLPTPVQRSAPPRPPRKPKGTTPKGGEGISRSLSASIPLPVLGALDRPELWCYLETSQQNLGRPGAQKSPTGGRSSAPFLRIASVDGKRGVQPPSAPLMEKRRRKPGT